MAELLEVLLSLDQDDFERTISEIDSLVVIELLSREMNDWAVEELLRKFEKHLGESYVSFMRDAVESMRMSCGGGQGADESMPKPAFEALIAHEEVRKEAKDTKRYTSSATKT